MSTIIIAIAMLVFIAAIVCLLMYVHNRDKKKEIANKIASSERNELP
jgi:hypothetical protein